MSHNIVQGEHSANRYTRDHRLCDTCRELKRVYQLDYRARQRKAKAELARANGRTK